MVQSVKVFIFPGYIIKSVISQLLIEDSFDMCHLGVATGLAL